jgi:hypothetical protein
MMLSIFKRGVFVLVATTLSILALGASPAVPDVGLQNVGLSCSDGTDLGLTLSTAEVSSLINAVTAMSLYPAGLTCGASTQAAAPTAGSKKFDSAVGGGDQFAFPKPTAACRHNFGFSAHTLSNSPTDGKGTYNETVPGGCAGLGDTGQLRIDIDCLDVNGTHADMHGTVRTATGQFATAGSDFAASGEAFISTTDNGSFDTLRVEPSSDVIVTSANPCGKVLSEEFIMHGNISVNDADG